MRKLLLAAAANTTPPIVGTLVSLLHMDVSNFPDATGNTVVASGTPTPSLDTTDFKFGPGSLSFTAANQSLLLYSGEPDLTPWNWSTGDFTVQLWTKLTSYTSSSGTNCRFLSTARNASGQNSWACGVTATGLLRMSSLDSSVVNYDATSGAIPLNTWTAIAWTRQTGILRAFVAGVKVLEVASVKPFGLLTDSSVPRVGAFVPGGTAANVTPRGLIDEIRVIKGFAAYTDNYTPETVPFTLSLS